MPFFPLCIGPAAQDLLSGGISFSGITLAVTAPEGDSMPQLLEQYMGNMSDISQYCSFQAMDEDTAAVALEVGKVTAILALPENFIQGIMDGTNPDVQLIIPSDRPLESLLTLWVGQSAADLLAAVQSGIYTVLETYEAAAPEGLSWEQVKLNINLRYISWTLNRQDMFRFREVSATQTLPVQLHYGLSLLAYLELSAAPLFFGVYGKRQAAFRRRLRCLGWGSLPGYFSGLAACTVVVFLLAAFPVLLPGLTWALLTFLPPQERTEPVQVGVALPEQGGEAFWVLLERRCGTVVTFVRADEAAVEGKVASGQWDCGLLLPGDFQSRLEAQDTDRLITLCIGQGSVVYPLVRESVSACLAELLSPGIAQEYLLHSGIADEDALRGMASRFERPLPESDRVVITMTTQDGQALDALTLADETLSVLLHGVISIVLLIWTLFSAVDMGRWLETPAAGRLHSLRDTTGLLLPQAAVAAVPARCSAGLALCLLPDGLQSPLPLFAYLSELCGLSLLAARSKKIWTAFPVLMPFVPVLCLLLSPIIFDFTTLFPSLAGLFRWMPVTLYLRACTGERSAAMLLWGGAAGTLLASFGLDWGANHL